MSKIHDVQGLEYNHRINEPPQSLEVLQNVNGLKQTITYTTIGGGIRSANLKTIDKPKNSVRLLCLGASTTDQATQRTEDTWCAHLVDKLALPPDSPSIDLHSLSYGGGGHRAVETGRWLRIMLILLLRPSSWRCSRGSARP